ESERMLFWNYYINKRYPKKMTWNSGRHRYFDNIWMAQILRDIISLKEDPQEHDLARRFFQHFCQINVINIERLSQPSGVLVGMENL
ncbi:MAG TPA: malate synthase, partial [bacterium]|nr:malate synthase [bacterium]